MLTRAYTIAAIFARPFILTGFDRIAPAGTYTMDVEEERSTALPGGLPGWRQVSMSIRIEFDGVMRHLPVDPGAFIAAMERDGAQKTQARFKKVARARRLTARNLNAFSGQRTAT